MGHNETEWDTIVGGVSRGYVNGLGFTLDLQSARNSENALI